MILFLWFSARGALPLRIVARPVTPAGVTVTVCGTRYTVVGYSRTEGGWQQWVTSAPLLPRVRRLAVTLVRNEREEVR